MVPGPLTPQMGNPKQGFDLSHKEASMKYSNSGAQIKIPPTPFLELVFYLSFEVKHLAVLSCANP